MATSNGGLTETVVVVGATDSATDVETGINSTASASSSSSSSSSQESVPPAPAEVKYGRCSARRFYRRLRDCLHTTREELEEPMEEMKVQGRRFIKKSCTVNSVLNTFPITRWLPKYRWKHFQGDFIAGLTVGLTVIPQGLAYAQVANLSPEYGLYSAFIGCFVYMILGTAKDITLGPTAIMSLLTAQFGNGPNATYAILLSLFSGIIQLAMGIFHIGFVVDYISHPVINSFTTSAAVTIAWSQINKWFGLKKVPRDFLNSVYWDFRKLPETRLWDFLMGLVCMCALLGMKKTRLIRWGKPEGMSRLKRAVKYVVWLTSTARNAVIVVLASVVSAIFLQYNLQPFGLTGKIKAGLPPFQVPNFTLAVGNGTMSTPDILANIGPGLAIVPILGLVETIAIGKAFARKYSYTIDADQELLAVGVANIIGSFVGAYPVTGSFSRTAVNAQSGVMTPAGGIWTAVLVLLALAFLTPLFFYIPDAALSAVIIMAVIDMIDFSLLLKLWRIKKIDLIPWIVTFVLSLCIGIEWGIITGIGLSLLLLLYPWARPKFQVNIVQLSNDDMTVMTLNHGLAFPGIEYFKDKIYSKALSGEIAKSVVLDFNSITHTDFTAVEGMHQLLQDFEKKKKKLVVCNLQPQILDIFIRAKLKHFEHASSVEEAIELIQTSIDESKKVPPSNSAISSGGVGGGGVDSPSAEGVLGAGDIERFTIYNDASDDEDKTDDETNERNYIVTSF